MRRFVVLVAATLVIIAVFVAAVVVLRANDDTNTSVTTADDVIWILARQPGQVWTFSNGTLVPKENVIASVLGNDWTTAMTISEVNTLVSSGELTLPASTQLREFLDTDVAELVINDAQYLVAVRRIPESEVGFIPSATVRGVAFQQKSEVIINQQADDTAPAAITNVDFDEGDLNWVLGPILKVDVVPFEFVYPVDWVQHIDVNRIALASNEEDLAVEVDGDPTTIPARPTITLNAIPLQNIDLTPDTSLGDRQDYVLSLVGLELQQAFDIPVMIYPSVTLVGRGPDGRHGLASMWIQNNSLMIFSLNTPDAQLASDLAYTWGVILGSLRPHIDVELAVPIGIPQSRIRIQYPVGWDSVEDSDSISASDPATGASLSAFLAPVSDFSDASSVDVNTLSSSIASVMRLEQASRKTHYLVLNLPAVGFVGQTTDGVWSRVFYTISGEDVLFVTYTAPTSDMLASFEETWLTILQTLQFAG